MPHATITVLATVENFMHWDLSKCGLLSVQAFDNEKTELWCHVPVLSLVAQIRTCCLVSRHMLGLGNRVNIFPLLIQ